MPELVLPGRFSDADYIAEIGYYIGGNFNSVLKSKITRTPRNSPKFSDYEIWVDLKKGSRKEYKASHEELVFERD